MQATPLLKQFFRVPLLQILFSLLGTFVTHQHLLSQLSCSASLFADRLKKWRETVRDSVKPVMRDHTTPSPLSYDVLAYLNGDKDKGTGLISYLIHILQQRTLMRPKLYSDIYAGGRVVLSGDKSGNQKPQLWKNPNTVDQYLSLQPY